MIRILLFVVLCGWVANQHYLQVISRRTLYGMKQAATKGTSPMLGETLKPATIGPQGSTVPSAQMAVSTKSAPRKFSRQSEGGRAPNPESLNTTGGNPTPLDPHAQVTMEKIPQVTTPMLLTTGTVVVDPEDGSKLYPLENSRANSAPGPVATVRGKPFR